jgi:aarF domain-containing kinase
MSYKGLPSCAKPEASWCAGTTYIKLGQFVASTPSLFPEEYVMEFQKCLDNTEKIPFDKIRALMAADLGRPLEEIYSFIDPVPMASASVAQVPHRYLTGTAQVPHRYHTCTS